MIRFENVTKVYDNPAGGKRVLDNQSFTIKRGETLGILGLNGAGKSTLTRLIAGIEHPTAGRIIREMSVSWPLGFGTAFQGSLTGADNARFVARIYRRPVDEVLDYVESFARLGPYFNMPFKTYSAGMRARLAFAVSLAINFECYLVDEIVAVGDRSFHDQCHEALQERSRRATLVMVSHSAEMLRQYCSSGALLRDGQLIFFDTVEEAIHAYFDMFAQLQASS